MLSISPQPGWETASQLCVEAREQGRLLAAVWLVVEGEAALITRLEGEDADVLEGTARAGLHLLWERGLTRYRFAGGCAVSGLAPEGALSELFSPSCGGARG